jgi:hypothetical protein
MNDNEIDNYNKIELEYLLKNLNISEDRKEQSLFFIGHLYSALVSLEIKYFNGKVILAKPDKCREFLLDCLDLEKDLDKGRRDMYNNRADIIGVFALNERSRFYNHRMHLIKGTLCKSFRQNADDFKK